MNRRRVLFIDHAAVLGGAELCLLDLAIAYRETGQVLLFADGPFRQRLEAAGVSVLVLPAPEAALAVRTSGGIGALKALPALWWMARQIAEIGKGFELIHANSQKAFIAAAIARLFGCPPVVWYLHDILTARHFSRINRAIAIHLANRFAVRVLVNSHATGESFVAAGGRQDFVSLVYNGIASAPFEHLPQKHLAEIRAVLGIGNLPLVGVFSRLSYWKGQHILLEAIQEIPNLHVLMVGETLFGEVEYTAKLKALAAKPELRGRVHWLGFRDDIPALMAACDIIAHTSTEPEPFGRVIVEGQLAQRPVIASAAGGALELVEDGVTGRLVPPGDPIALANVIRDLLSDPATAADMANRGYARACDRFSLKNLIHTYDLALTEREFDEAKR